MARTVSLESKVFASAGIKVNPDDDTSAGADLLTITGGHIDAQGPYSSHVNFIENRQDALLNLIEKHGILPWSDLTAYEPGALCKVDRTFYQLVEGGDGTQDPSTDDGANWEEFTSGGGGSSFVDVQTEEITLALDQTEVTLSNASTSSMELYIEGAREFDFTVTGQKTFELPESFPDGTRIWVVSAEVYADAENIIVESTAGSSRTLKGWVDGQVYSYATLQDALSDNSISGGSHLSIMGRITAFDGGGQTYEAVPSGTGVVDGGEYIDHPLTGLQLRGLFRDGVKRAQQWGVIGDYDTDDTAAIDACVLHSQKTGDVIDFGNLKCRHTGTIELVDSEGKGARIRGNGNPKIATFPLGREDKEFLRPGYKHLMPGCAIYFDGTGTPLTYSTDRTDKFATLTPMVAAMEYGHYDIDGIGFLQDMDVYDAGGSLTTGTTDNRASAYNCGFITRTIMSTATRVTVWGYFSANGTIVVNDDGSADPDYNSFTNCLLSSGVAAIGSDGTISTPGPGLTGTRLLDCGIYGADHHVRADGDYTVNPIYCDGVISGSTIRGLTLIGCNVRGLANDFIKLDRCTDVQFIGGTYEAPASSGITNADQAGVVTGTSNTGDVRFVCGATNATLGIDELAAQIGGKLITVGSGALGSIMVSNAGSGVRIAGDSASGDSRIQLTDDFTSNVTGWLLTRDADQSDEFVMRYDNSRVFGLRTDGSFSNGFGSERGATQEISSGSVSRPRSNYFAVSAEGGASSDSLATIAAGDYDGQRVTIRSALSSQAITVSDGTGNIRCGTDFVMTNSLDRMELMWSGSFWVEMSRSSN